MSVTFDVETLHFSSAVGRASYLVVFVIVAIRLPRETYLRHWIGAILASMIGSAIMARVPVTRWLSASEAFIIYTLYISSLALSWSGLRVFNSRTVKLSTLALMVAAPSTFYVALLLVGAPMREALASVFVFCMAYAGLAGFEAVHRSQSIRLWSRYIIATTFVFYLMVFVLTFSVLVGTDIPMNSAESGQWSMILDQATGILVYFGYIAMAGERAVLTVHRLAETDTLTELTNRRGLQVALERSERASHSGRPTGVLIADIDNFKAINDTYGHKAGDMILIAFSRRFRTALRAEDIAVRWGGEEFLAVLPDVDIDWLATIAERLRASIEVSPFALPNGRSVPITVSIGISAMTGGPREFEHAAQQADVALYKAKTEGRNRVCDGSLITRMPIVIGCSA
ncbi:GGDEF domain-containing protein [Sphingomonas sp. PP-CE-1G-424]|uniref:GGDEF domain-containing protein n=1 Tax=Sphingomonas sp. PP-CE-1G-424 TaxID=2135658 RepID=UPI0010557C84|nr:GGDEF domain-containing protein [Sphingomonas sp. PP-CE-1G-424]TCP65570.1 diguanylate cyclase (GGDEF)-like protein [Sphingomonas sp. PP-CE-1G-424]